MSTNVLFWRELILRSDLIATKLSVKVDDTIEESTHDCITGTTITLSRNEYNRLIKAFTKIITQEKTS